MRSTLKGIQYENLYLLLLLSINSESAFGGSKGWQPGGREGSVLSYASR